MTTIITILSTLRTSNTVITIITTSMTTKKASPACTTVTITATAADHPATPNTIPLIKRHLLRSAVPPDACALAKRDGLDGLPITISTTLFVTATLITLPASSTTTTISTADVTSTATITPPPFTKFSGTVEKMITLPVKTVTTMLRPVSTTAVTQTKTHKLKATVTVTPSTFSG